VHILDHIDYVNLEPFKQDMERALVHELLHIKFDHICHPKGDITKHQHQLLNDMAVALVRVKREGKSVDA
jgi:hypothetical protein